MERKPQKPYTYRVDAAYRADVFTCFMGREELMEYLSTLQGTGRDVEDEMSGYIEEVNE